MQKYLTQIPEEKRSLHYALKDPIVPYQGLAA
ncbi:hypothetical protein CP8484711_1737, partial [Chlamydia psittaci 84-8471/1]